MLKRTYLKLVEMQEEQARRHLDEVRSIHSEMRGYKHDFHHHLQALKGQLEAGQCVGMSYLQIIRRIILPQALRTAFPTLASSLIAMIKDTSLAANITVTEMFMTTQRIVARTYEPLALYIEVGLVYLLFCTVLTRLQAVGERYLNSRGAQRS